MGKQRPQQYRLIWPLTPFQVQNIDSMFETLFRTFKDATFKVAQIVGILPISQGGTGASTAGAALDNLFGFSTTGFIIRNGLQSYLTRILTAGFGITITNPDGVSGNPTIAWNGQNSGHWEPLSQASGTFPELIFDSFGNVIMAFVQP